MSDESIKEAMDWIAFNDNMHRATQLSVLKKLKTLYPKLYKEWFNENEDLIKKWDIPA